MNVQIEIKKALQKWAKQNRITPADLADQTDIGYQHAWNLLRGNRPVTDEILGRLFKAYGDEGPMVAIAEVIEKYRNNGGRR